MVEIIKYQGFDHIWQYSGPWLYYLLAIYVSLPVLAYKVLPYLFLKKRSHHNRRKSVLIFVLGDLGHSPRMCYHALSFSQLEYNVNLCGYVETRPLDKIVDDINIEITPIEVVKNSENLPFVLFAAKKIILQVSQVARILYKYRDDTDFVMIQNPPSIPILLVVIFFKILADRQLKIIIDWHNLNYTILNMRFQNFNNWLVRWARAYEKFLARFASLNITVTKKMKSFLVEEFQLDKGKVTTLYDKPGPQFQPVNDKKILYSHELVQGIDNIEHYKVLVSATSFTPDEDFSILLNALKLYEKETKSPPVLLIVTGKGPLKTDFLQMVENLKFSPSKVVVRTAWLTSEEYPKILASADLGISLHTSSSGIDLPMKIVDFFGCGIPVVSLNFPAIDELVKDGENGLVAENSTSDEVCSLLTQAFTDDKLLKHLKMGAIDESKSRWNENWIRVLQPKFENS
ncbi:ALG1 [Candida oxycetoniae]|uniref:Chitobiosyldiphosphodolichol beta-mannosyltransferase n=1 Tax=Candida oxycetoniae TaxID=497107 RepID=A0AAI9SZG9_9ASCO|nr:ALG1 [Candida oxycetoniae]KAI3405549.2 ALG1 [Candida oxycetoniae]